MLLTDAIDTQKTLQKRRIVFASKFTEVWEFFETILFSFFCIVLIGFAGFAQTRQYSPNDRFIIYCIPFFIIFLCYTVYKKIVERRLLVIPVTASVHRPREMVADYVSKKDWNLHINNKDCIQADTYDNISWGYAITILFTEGEVLLNVMSANPKIRRPIFFEDKSIQKELIKFIAAI